MLIKRCSVKTIVCYKETALFNKEHQAQNLLKEALVLVLSLMTTRKDSLVD